LLDGFDILPLLKTLHICYYANKRATSITHLNDPIKLARCLFRSAS